MKYIYAFLLLLVFSCGKPSESTSSNSLGWKDSISAENPSESSTTSSASNPTETTDEATENYSDPVGDELEAESENMENNAWEEIIRYAGEYTLESSSEAENGSSLTLTHVDRFIFNITITKMVADFCSGTISSEINLDHFPTATFDGGGHPVTIILKDGKIEVKDPERQLGVGTCEYNGTFSNIMDGIN